MAKSVSFTVFKTFRQNPKPYLLSPLCYFTTGRDESFSEVAGEICEIIRTRPRWEESLISQFPLVNFSDPKLFNEVLKLQNNAFLSLRLFNWLKSQSGFSFLPDNSSCKCLFNSLVKTKASVLAKSFMDSMPHDFKNDPDYFESSIRVLFDDGHIDGGLDLLKKMKSFDFSPSILTWNRALSGSVLAKRTDVVWNLYEAMMDSGVAPDVETVGCLIEAFCIDNKVEKGYELLSQIQDGRVLPSNMRLVKLTSGFSKMGCDHKVLKLLHLMIATDRNPDVYIYQGIIYWLCKRGKGEKAYRIFNNLKSRGYALDRVMYTTMINGLCRMRVIGEARNLWFEMMKKGMIPNEYTYKCLIDGYCSIYSFKHAWKLHKEMCDRSCKLNTMSYNILITILCKNKKTIQAYDLFEEMTRNGIIPDLITYNSLILGFCKVGDSAKARTLFDELVARGLQPSTSSYGPLIKHLSEVGSTEKAVELWMCMMNKGVKPSMYIWECILAGLCIEGSCIEGVQWLYEMLKKKLIPQRKFFVSLIQSLLQQDKLDISIVVVNSMLHIGYPLGYSLCYSLVRKLCTREVQLLPLVSVNDPEKAKGSKDKKPCSRKKKYKKKSSSSVPQTAPSSSCLSQLFMKR